MKNRYLKNLDGKWWDVHVEFDENDVGHVVDVFITEEKPDIDERLIIYMKQWNPHFIMRERSKIWN